MATTNKNRVVMNLSIIPSDIPSLNQFFAELQIGHGTRIPTPPSDHDNLNTRRTRSKVSKLSFKPLRSAPDSGIELKSNNSADLTALPESNRNRTRGAGGETRRLDAQSEEEFSVMQSW